MYREAVVFLTAVLLAAASGYSQTASTLGSVSTRAHVGPTDDQLISGWIVNGSGSANVLIRALGPSLPNVSGRLADPVLSLFDMNGDQIYSNDNWKDSPQRAAIEATGRQPGNDLESAILAPVPAGQFTSIVSGNNNTTGIAKVEMIDLDPSTAPSIINKSTRARAGIGNAAPLDEFVIAGSEPRKVIIRGIGPSLRSAFVANYLADPTLTLRDSSGQLLAFNNNWRDTQQAEVQASNLAPSENAESAIVATLAPGTYTAELQGVCGGTGVALIEVFDLGSATTPSVPLSSHVFSCGPDAPSVVVTNTNDSGAGSLRAAIAAAPAGGTIGFSKSTAGGAVNFYDGNPHTITLTSGMLTIDKSLTIAAPNPNLLTVSGNNASRVFQVNAGVIATIDSLRVANGAITSIGSDAGGGIRNAGTLKLSKCIVANCAVTGTSAGAETFEVTTGGGIWNIGTLSLTETVVTNNSVSGGLMNQGAGIISDNGTVTISNSVIANNTATARPDQGSSSGGGIYALRGSTTISRSTFSGNSCNGAPGASAASTGGSGGAIFSHSGALTITDSEISNNSVVAAGSVTGAGINLGSTPVAARIARSTIHGNSLSGGERVNGGGIHASGDLTVVDSTISSNSARDGGGIYFASGGAVLTVTNSTIAANTAIRTGAGIYNNFGRAYLNGATIAANVVSGGASESHGGGIFSLALPPASSSRLHCRNTIIAANTAATGPDIAGSIISLGHNLISNTNGATVTGETAGNVLNQDANLGSLANNGGPTKTMRVLPASPAIDGGADFTKLASAIDASTTSITVANFHTADEVTAFPAGVGFVLRIDAEQMIVTARSGNTLTVTRGADGTSPAAHAAGTGVNPAFDQRGLPRKAGNAIDIGAFETNYALSITAGGTQSTTVGSAFGTAFQLQLLENGQPLAGISVTFTAPSSGASGTFAGGATTVTVVTDANGLATSPLFTANGRAGTYTVVVKFGSHTSAISYELTNLPRTQLLNIATRMKVLTGDNILIGGFIVTGTDAKKIVVRGIGPSIAVAGALSDPVLQLFDSAGNIIASNDDWKVASDGTSQQAEVEQTGIAPSDDRESALIATVPAGGAQYTAALSGKGETTGIGLVEVYDVNNTEDSQLANISTRGFVDTGDNVMIGGFILGGGATSNSVLVRGIGPSLADSGVENPLSDPQLELYDANGEIVAANDDWKRDEATGASQEAAIAATTIPPTNDRESAILITLQPGAYTALLAGKNGTTGVGLVELYNLK